MRGLRKSCEKTSGANSDRSASPSVRFAKLGIILLIGHMALHNINIKYIVLVLTAGTVDLRVIEPSVIVLSAGTVDLRVIEPSQLRAREPSETRIRTVGHTHQITISTHESLRQKSPEADCVERPLFARGSFPA